MAKSPAKVVWFLGGAGARGSAAAAEFNAVAGRFGMPWVARAGGPDDGVDAVALVVVLVPPPTPPEIRSCGSPVEEWHVGDGSAAGANIGREVSGLVARLLGGRVVSDLPDRSPAKAALKKIYTVRVGRETAGRRGKGVTTVFDLPLTGDGLRVLAATLKQKCGTGGTVKDGCIEIQGDHRDAVVAELEKHGYKVKRSGG